MEWSKEEKACIWTEIVSEKINKQAQLLEKLHFQESSLLKEYLLEIELGDVTNREGHAAKVYFNALFGKKFTRNEENPINAALNYGYSLLLSSFNREIAANGYITQIGLFHDNQFNQFNLASDFMEPYRPIVDELVYQMMPVKFEKNEKHTLLKIFEKEVMLDGKRELLVNAIKMYTKSVFDALNEQNRFLIKFYQNEL